MAPTLLVYIAAQADEKLRKQCAKHLSLFVQQGMCTEWHESLLLPGAFIAEERKQAWHNANIMLVFLSVDLFQSEAYDDHEMQLARERQKRGQLKIFPILLRHCSWEGTALGGLTCLPRDGKPIADLDKKESAFFSIAQEVRQFLSAPTPVGRASLTASQRTSRQRLIKRVRTIWITNFLEKILGQTTWVDLHLQKQADAVANPWRVTVQELDQQSQPLPPGTSILQVLAEADEELLILGEAGAGKTMLLLYLARTLLAQAEIDEQRRMPVLFHLATWVQQRLTFEQWLVNELHSKYDVPLSVGNIVLKADTIFPLLDGLDEVAATDRAACVQAIKDFAQRQPEQTPLVICCRSQEYRSLPQQLALHYAVMLLPFTDEQINYYLTSVSGRYSALRDTLSQDQELYELARRPLMLSVFTQAYVAAPAELPVPIEHKDYPRALFQYYVNAMLTRRGQLQEYTPQQVKSWLGFLAHQMKNQHEILISIENIQPTWLPVPTRTLYRWCMTLVYALTFGLIFGPIFALSFGCTYGILHQDPGQLWPGLLIGLNIGCAGGLPGGLCFGLTFPQHYHIQPSEVAAWSGEAARRGLVTGTLGGLLVGLAGGLIGSFLISPTVGIVLGIATEVVVALVGMLVGGFTPLQLPAEIDLTPNAGIWRSGKRGFLLVLPIIALIGMAGGLLVSLFGKSLVTVANGPLIGLALGSTGGLIFGLAFGLVGGRTGIAAFLQHFILRFFFWKYKLLPLRLVHFLDMASERLLLRKVGRSYLFVHRILREVLEEEYNR